MGVELAHARERVEVVGLPTVKLPGAVGAVATATLVVAVLVPFAFVAVRVYIVVEVGFTVIELEAVDVLKPPGLMAMFVIVPVAFQLRTEAEPLATTVGEAVKEAMEGGAPGPDVNANAEAEYPAPPEYPVNVAWYVPAATFRASSPPDAVLENAGPGRNML